MWSPGLIYVLFDTKQTTDELFVTKSTIEGYILHISITLFPLRISLATMLARRPNMWPRPSITIAFGENPGILLKINNYKYLCEFHRGKNANNKIQD